MKKYHSRGMLDRFLKKEEHKPLEKIERLPDCFGQLPITGECLGCGGYFCRVMTLAAKVKRGGKTVDRETDARDDNLCYFCSVKQVCDRTRAYRG